MKKTEIKDRILTILEYGRINRLDSSYELVNKTRSISEIYNDKPIICIDNPEDYKFINKQVILLKSQYIQLDNQDKKIFITYLLKHLKPDNNEQHGRLSFNTMVHIGEFSQAFSYICKNFNGYKSQYFYSEIFSELSQIICYEWNIFKRNEIKKISSWIDKVDRRQNNIGKEFYSYNNLFKEFSVVFFDVYKKLNSINYQNFEKEIFQGFNPEINEDKEKLIDDFKRYNFPNDLSQILEVIDQKISNASNGFDFKECMGHIRTFTERLYESIANSIDIKDGKKMNSIDSEEVANFFIKKELISQDQGKILTSLQHFLSNLGVHRLKSKSEDARLSRNMAIEFSLYLMNKLKDTRN